jgi:hypothetical protein
MGSFLPWLILKSQCVNACQRQCLQAFFRATVMALLPTRMACYFSQRYGLTWLDHQPSWLCTFVTLHVTGCLLVLIACWVISGYCHSCGLLPHSGHSKPCRVCVSIVEGCFFKQLSFSSSYCLDPLGN